MHFQDSTIWFAFIWIAMMSDLFCHICSHTYGIMHTCMFTCVSYRIRIPHIWNPGFMQIQEMEHTFSIGLFKNSKHVTRIYVIRKFMVSSEHFQCYLIPSIFLNIFCGVNQVFRLMDRMGFLSSQFFIKYLSWMAPVSFMMEQLNWRYHLFEYRNLNLIENSQCIDRFLYDINSSVNIPVESVTYHNVSNVNNQCIYHIYI